MFLEYWMIVILAAIFIVGLWDMNRKGFTEGVAAGAEGALEMLEREGIIDVSIDGEISSSKCEKNSF
jgi:hypothetical protein